MRPRTWLSRLADTCADTHDAPEDRTKKGVLALSAAIIGLLALFWGIAYNLLGFHLPGLIPLGYAALSFFGLAHFLHTRRYRLFRNTQLALILVLPFLLQWSLGGFANGSAVMIWAFFTPLTALYFAGGRHAWRWLAGFVALTVVSGVIDGDVARHAAAVPTGMRSFFFVLDVGIGGVMIFLVTQHFVRSQDRAHRQALQAMQQAHATQAELEQANAALVQNEIRIRELLLTDPLTGVANRRHLEEFLEREAARARRYGAVLSVVMIDIDYFKRINDTYGHDGGDAVLQATARILGSYVRNVDLLARYGGEEFILVLPETTADEAARLAERIRLNLQRTPIAPLPQPITASFGVAALDAAGSVRSLLKRADEALYQAKGGGRNRVMAAPPGH